MQTRKNRKNDETSYEKMLKLRRDLSRAVTLLEMVKRREKTKRELLHLTVEVYEKRCVNYVNMCHLHHSWTLLNFVTRCVAHCMCEKSTRKLYHFHQVSSRRLQWTVVGRSFSPQELPACTTSFCTYLSKSIQHWALDQQGSHQGNSGFGTDMFCLHTFNVSFLPTF